MPDRYGYALWQFAAGGQVERDTLTCCHCGGFYVVQPGSGKRRGWCTLCSAPTCGKPGCVPCTPLERRLAAMENSAKLMRALETS